MLVASGCFNGMLTNIAVLKAKAIYDERTVALHIFKRTVICNCYDMKYTGTVYFKLHKSIIWWSIARAQSHQQLHSRKIQLEDHFNDFNSLNKIAHVTHVHSETTPAIMISPPFRDHLPPNNGSSNCFLVPLYSAERRWLSTSLKAKKGSASASVIISKAMVSGCCSIHCGSSQLTTGWLSCACFRRKTGVRIGNTVTFWQLFGSLKVYSNIIHE